MGQLDLTDFSAFSRAGKSTFLVSEQLTFHQGLRNRCAVHRDERSIFPGAFRVNQAGEKFFSCSALPCDQNICVVTGCHCRLAHKLPHLLIRKDQLILDPICISLCLVDLLLNLGERAYDTENIPVALIDVQTLHLEKELEIIHGPVDLTNVVPVCLYGIFSDFLHVLEEHLAKLRFI